MGLARPPVVTVEGHGRRGGEGEGDNGKESPERVHGGGLDHEKKSDELKTESERPWGCKE